MFGDGFSLFHLQCWDDDANHSHCRICQITYRCTTTATSLNIATKCHDDAALRASNVRSRQLQPRERHTEYRLNRLDNAVWRNKVAPTEMCLTQREKFREKNKTLSEKSAETLMNSKTDILHWWRMYDPFDSRFKLSSLSIFELFCVAKKRKTGMDAYNRFYTRQSPWAALGTATIRWPNSDCSSLSTTTKTWCHQVREDDMTEPTQSLGVCRSKDVI